MTEKSLQELALDFVSSMDERSFTLLHNRLKPGLKKFIQRYHQDPETVDDILAITLSKAYVYADTYDPSIANFSTWIYRTCQNECLMEIRRKNQLYSLNSLMESKAPIRAINGDDWKTEEDYEFFSEEEVIQSHNLYEEILEEITQLPAHYKEIIEDKIINKLKYKEIAEKRSLPINTVRSRIHSAKKVIKNRWIEKKKLTNSKVINIVGVTILELLEDRSSRVPIHKKDATILTVMYGSGDVWFDVTEKAKKLFSEKGEVKSSNRLGGDPCYGVQKKMLVTWLRDGKEMKAEIVESKVFKG